MKKFLSYLFILLLTLTNASVALAEVGSRQGWFTAKVATIEADAAYRKAQLDYQADKTPENDAAVIEAAKHLMNAALDEVAAWLKWKDGEAQADSKITTDLKATINADVAANLAKIEVFRKDVAGVKTRLQAIGVYLKLVAGYTGLLTDVARDSGLIWVTVGNSWIEKTSDYEAKLRAAALKVDHNAKIIEALDAAKTALSSAGAAVEAAKATYEQVRLPGTPLVKFSQGNAQLRLAQTQLLEAQTKLISAFTLLQTNS